MFLLITEVWSITRTAGSPWKHKGRHLVFCALNSFPIFSSYRFPGQQQSGGGQSQGPAGSQGGGADGGGLYNDDEDDLYS